MSRPSRNTDQLLLRAGRELISKTGFSGLKVRQIAARAGVNLGMFHYYFKTKEKFARNVLQELYEEFFKRFSIESSGKGDSKERLRRALNILGRFVRDNRKLILVLLQDVLQGHKEIIKFARDNVPRHLSIIISLIKQCQKEGSMRKMSAPMVISFLLGSIASPNFAVEIIKRATAGEPIGLAVKIVKSVLLSDSAISERVDMALKGIS